MWAYSICRPRRSDGDAEYLNRRRRLAVTNKGQRFITLRYELPGAGDDLVLNCPNRPSSASSEVRRQRRLHHWLVSKPGCTTVLKPRGRQFPWSMAAS